MPSLAEAVRKAALCVTREGKRHNHQRRLPGDSLEQAAQRLAQVDLSKARDFNDLLAWITEACDGIPMFGDLTRYDVTFRIGLYLDKLPQRVYIHAGTRKGARALGLDHRRPTLEMDELPSALRRLQPWQVEDFLCVYKSDLERLVQ